MEPLTTRYRKVFLLLTAGGTYIPGLDTKLFGRQVPLALLYNIIAFLYTAVMCADMFLVGMQPKNSFNVAFFYVAISMSFIRQEIEASYFYFNYHKLLDIFKFWSDNIQSQWFPRIQRKCVDIKMSSAYGSVKWCYIALTIYCWGRGFLNMSTQHLFYGTIVCKGFSTTFSLFYQSSSILLIYTRFISFDFTLRVLLMMVVAELEYLTELMTSITSTVPVEDNGYINVGDGRKFDYVRKNLSIWLQHHAQVMALCNKVSKFVSPLMAVQYVYVTVNLCSLFTVSQSADLSRQAEIAMMLYQISHMILTVRMYRVGDQIMELSENLAKAAVSSNWVGLPLDIRKTLIFICNVTQRPMAARILGLWDVSSPTFYGLISLQYRIYRFIVDTR